MQNQTMLVSRHELPRYFGMSTVRCETFLRNLGYPAINQNERNRLWRIADINAALAIAKGQTARGGKFAPTTVAPVQTYVAPVQTYVAPVKEQRQRGRSFGPGMTMLGGSCDISIKDKEWLACQARDRGYASILAMIVDIAGKTLVKDCAGKDTGIECHNTATRTTVSNGHDVGV